MPKNGKKKTTNTKTTLYMYKLKNLMPKNGTKNNNRHTQNDILHEQVKKNF